MSFFPIQQCCMQLGTDLPGTPTGTFEPPSTTHPVGRYIARPSHNVNPAVGIALLYDMFGLGIPNPKLTADKLAERLGLDVHVIDFIPDPPKADKIDGFLEPVPGKYKDRSWLGSVSAFLSFFVNVVTYIPSVLDGRVFSLTDQGIAQMKADGYQKIGAIGYCRGGSCVAHLLSKGDDSPVECGILCHPGPDTKLWEGFTKPSQWHLASEDARLGEKTIAHLRQTFEKKKPDVQFECTIYPETTHGFAGRPTLSHEPTKAAFDRVHEAAIKFFTEQLLDK